jgi:type II secretory pathway pseudopilin PulG
MNLRGQGTAGESGYAMAALLVALNVMAVVLTVALPTWRTMMKREKESELIWRGQQYARAIGLFQRKYANTFPPNLDILLNERFLRKKYKDPMTKDGEFQLLYAASQNAPGQPGQPGVPGQPQAPGQSGPGQVQQRGQTGTPSPLDVGSQGPAGARGGIMGVASKSTDSSLREYNGRTKYNEWAFVWQAASTRPGAPPVSGAPGMPGGSPQPGMPQPGGGRGPGGQQPGSGPGRGFGTNPGIRPGMQRPPG